MTATFSHVDVYFSYRSPYSYLAIPRLSEWVREDEVDIIIRPVLPQAVINPKFFTEANPLMVPYSRNDMKRVAEFYEIPFVWPNPDPVVMEFGPVHIPLEQPYIHRLTRLGIEAGRKGRSLEYTREVATLIWSGSVENWTDANHLSEAVERAGLDLAAMDHAIEDNPNLYIKAIDENHAERTKVGHWGAPIIVIDGEPFFGQDRIELAKWRHAKNRFTPNSGHPGR